MVPQNWQGARGRCGCPPANPRAQVQQQSRQKRGNVSRDNPLQRPFKAIHYTRAFDNPWSPRTSRTLRVLCSSPTRGSSLYRRWTRSKRGKDSSMRTRFICTPATSGWPIACAAHVIAKPRSTSLCVMRTYTSPAKRYCCNVPFSIVSVASSRASATSPSKMASLARADHSWHAAILAASSTFGAAFSFLSAFPPCG